MKVVLSATLSLLYCVRGGFNMFTDTQDLDAKLFTSFLISPFVFYWH